MMLAKAEGHHAFFCSGSPERRAALERQGIVGIDQKAFNRFASRDDVRAFSAECRKLTNGVNMHLVCDMLRGPCFEAGLSVSARCGVRNVSGGLAALATSDLQLDLDVGEASHDRPPHYETVEGCGAATELYGVVFKPTLHKEIYAFEDMPRHARMYLGTQTGIPIIRVARELPERVKLWRDGQGSLAAEVGAEVYPFSQLVADGKATWDGVRNRRRATTRCDAEGDLVLFYHSHDTEIVGLACVTRTAFPDPTAGDPRWLAVELAALEPLPAPVSLRDDQDRLRVREAGPGDSGAALGHAGGARSVRADSRARARGTLDRRNRSRQRLGLENPGGELTLSPPSWSARRSARGRGARNRAESAAREGAGASVSAVSRVLAMTELSREIELPIERMRPSSAVLVALIEFISSPVSSSIRRARCRGLRSPDV
jgi:hypothetical protein